eukprot:TRINITY_DN3051_c0_g2_i4.p1 TRINITY_DN3051_c0_g2~~TRINITY_DN3051_c0_g2_i4.p1  ORF type:complete len:430 (+),score=147.97 TRINITY_DN3051_c0_g2_i4:52-1341(+)
MPKRKIDKVESAEDSSGKKSRSSRSEAKQAEEKKEVVEHKEEKIDHPFGEVLTLGSNECLQLGLGEDVPSRKKPAVVKTFEGKDVVAVAAGALHNAAVLSNGQLWTWGCNDEKALGREGAEWEAHQVTHLLGNKKVIQVACGDSHTVALTDDGSVYTWGTYRDSAGILGFNNKGVDKQVLPALVSALQGHRVVQIAGGENHDLALTDAGLVFEWGNTKLGRRMTERHKLNRLVPELVRFPGRRQPFVTKIVALGASSFVLTDTGDVYAWGLNNCGQCGVAKTPKTINLLTPTRIESLCGKNIVDVAGGIFHSLFLTADGKVLSCGASTYGQLGHGDKVDSHEPKEIAALQLQGDRVVGIGGGGQHSLAVTANGDLYSWGFGEMLQLGTGEEDDQVVPVLVEGQQLETRRVLEARGGAQHTILRACQREA